MVDSCELSRGNRTSPAGWHRTYSYYHQDVPQKDYRLDGSNFVDRRKARSRAEVGIRVSRHTCQLDHLVAGQPDLRQLL